MLQNAYVPEKFGFDTAENEPAKKWQILLDIANFANLVILDPTFAAAGFFCGWAGRGSLRRAVWKRRASSSVTSKPSVAFQAERWVGVVGP